MTNPKAYSYCEHNAHVMLVACMVILLSCSPSAKAPRARTLGQLTEIHHVIQVLEQTNGLTIQKQMLAISDTNVVRSWRRLLVLNKDKLQMTEDEIEKFLCRDGYGRLFNVQFSSNLFIWSSGKNGVNEFGQGDDLIPPLDARYSNSVNHPK